MESIVYKISKPRNFPCYLTREQERILIVLQPATAMLLVFLNHPA